MSSSLRAGCLATVALVTLLSDRGFAQPMSYSLADGNANWPADIRTTIDNSMKEAVALHNQYGWFEKHDTANYSSGVPTAQSNYDGWIDFGHLYNTRTALHEIAHTLGTGTYWGFDGGAWNEDSAAGRLEKLYDGQAAVLSTGGTHFWPYGLNYDNEDGPANRERHCKLVAALRFDMGIVKDSDGDGMPDDWETFHFQGLTQGAKGDPDADGITNIDEYGSDSDPKVACPVRDGHTYVVRSQISDRAMTLTQSNVQDGTKISLRKDGAPGQEWTAHYVGAGFWRFSSGNSEQVLSLPSKDTASAIPLQLTKWNQAFAQQWRVVSGPGAKDNYFQLANRETGRVADCLDGAENAAVEQYPFLGNLQQQFWTFEDVTSADVPADPGSMTDAGVSTKPTGDASTSTSAPTSTSDASVRGDASVRSDAGRAADAGLPTETDDDETDDGASAPATHDKSDGGCALVSDDVSGLSTLLLAFASLLRKRRRSTKRRPDVRLV